MLLKLYRIQHLILYHFQSDYIPNKEYIKLLLKNSPIRVTCKLHKFARWYTKGYNIEDLSIMFECSRERIREILIDFIREYDIVIL